MSIAKAKKGGDLVAILECPNDDHTVDLNTGRGFFLIDCADVARKTMEGMLKYADETQDVVGCAGHLTAPPPLQRPWNTPCCLTNFSVTRVTQTTWPGLTLLAAVILQQPVDPDR